MDFLILDMEHFLFFGRNKQKQVKIIYILW